MRPIILHYNELNGNKHRLMIACPFSVREYTTHERETRTMVRVNEGAEYMVDETMEQIQQLVLAALTEY